MELLEKKLNYERTILCNICLLHLEKPKFLL